MEVLLVSDVKSPACLRDFLYAKYREAKPYLDTAFLEEQTFARYRESINPDALSNDWLENRTSYIWKVGVLAVMDSNKMDFATVMVGHERAPLDYQLIGCLDWKGGENDDIAHSLERAVDCVKACAPIFSGHFSMLDSYPEEAGIPYMKSPPLIQLC